ncbi:peptidylprolyl cis-trans isomerase [Polaribacter irgensii 23-P]|uniref:Periplasmic chaperone PpiD n=1 Tax=Polaribacter irgensii 23-P TaxID=313594 RepID=A4BW22_9FLAO|nr:peptidylprolyl isomerase [Polaribacter irgensii]EAR13163.1 peptidylprolyl cis-trans isomerase [Polaribacter irgensii 23-P]
MAILSKIRERSMFLIIIIGLALFAFVLDPSTLGDFFSSSKVNEVGQVNGEAISRQEFAEAVDQYKQNSRSEVSEMQAANAVWDNILRKKIYKNQLEDAGISVGEQDVWSEILKVPSVQDNPQFQNEAGLFDELKFKQFLADTKENNQSLWSAWSNYMGQIKENTETNTYNSLVTAGLGASLKEGEMEYVIENTKLSGDFVYVSYASIADSLVSIKRSEVAAYIKANENEFKAVSTRDISYVKFDIKATAEDEEAIKQKVGSLIGDASDRNNEVIVGFKNATDDKVFLVDNGSDLNLDEDYKFNASISQAVANDIFSGNEGDVFGPYKDQGYFKISKIRAVTKMPDSVRASHILIPFLGSQRGTAEVSRTKAQAEELADSILRVVKRSDSKFASLAKSLSSDTGSAAKGGDLDWFNYARMTPAFRDYAFTNSKGAVGVVETPFGYHVIRIDDTKNTQKVLKLSTYASKIIPSEATENDFFQKAEQFALAVSKTTDYTALAKENNYNLRAAVGLEVLDENVPGLGNERQIVSWAFKGDSKIGSFNRFDLTGSYVVAVVTSKTEKGLMSVEKALNTVRPILLNEKKAALISANLKGSSLAAIAAANNTTVRNAKDVNLKTASLVGVGVEPKIVGAMYGAELNKVYNAIVGNRGVFSFALNKKEAPTALPNYEVNRKRISASRKAMTFKIYEAIKSASEVEDNRASMYGSN